MILQFPPGFDYVKQDLDNLGHWEKRTTEYINTHLKPGQHFLDVGAQVGYFSILAAQLGAMVDAIEPSSVNRALLKQNVIDNGHDNKINILPYALSNMPGEVRLYTGKTSGEHSLKQNFHNGDGFEVVKAVRFDDLEIGIPDMIKMDIEGGEQEALMGMQTVLNTTKPITLIIEDWHNHVTDRLVDEYGWNLVTTDRMSGNRILTKNMPYTYEEEPVRCHLIGTFNSPNTLKPEGIGNAFGTKVINMAKILKKLGHYVIFYGVEGSEVPCDEFVVVSPKEVLLKTYGPWDGVTIYPENYGDSAHTYFNNNTIREINKRKRVGDFLLLCHGTFQKPIADAVNIPETIEIGIGHSSSFARFRIFESEFQRAWTYGREDHPWNTNPIPGGRHPHQGNFYDTVIPGYFDPDDFIYSALKDDYFLYLGRIMNNKGIYVAQQVCAKLGKKLVVSGFYYAGDKKWFDEFIKLPGVEYVGFADKEKRMRLMASAKALFLPTLYLEPFGYVIIEANMSGTPVITTDFGAFPEIVKQGVTGFRCNTFREFCDAVQNIDKISSNACRSHAMKFTLEQASRKYQKYFTRILGLTGKGWYA